MTASAPLPEWIGTVVIAVSLAVVIPALVAHIIGDARERRGK